MTSKGKITVKHYLNSRLQESLVGYPVYVQIIVKRKTTQIRSRFERFGEFKTTYFKQEEFDSYRQKGKLRKALECEEKLIVRMISAMNPFDDDEFKLTYFNEVYSISSLGVYDFFKCSLTNLFKQVISENEKYGYFANVINWDYNSFEILKTAIQSLPKDYKSKEAPDLMLHLVVLISHAVIHLFENNNINVYDYVMEQYKDKIGNSLRALRIWDESYVIIIEGVIHAAIMMKFQEAYLLSRGEKDLVEQSNFQITKELIERAERFSDLK